MVTFDSLQVGYRGNLVKDTLSLLGWAGRITVSNDELDGNHVDLLMTNEWHLKIESWLAKVTVILLETIRDGNLMIDLQGFD